MDVIQGSILFREGKKWKQRFAVLRPNASNPDIHAIVFYKDANHARRKGNHKRIIHLLGFCGIADLGKLDKVEHGLAVVTANETIYLAFDSYDTRDRWRTHIQEYYGKEKQYVVVVPERQKIKAGEALLHIYSKFFGLTSAKTYRCIGRWPFKELHSYASIHGGFMFQIIGNGQSKGPIYKVSTHEGDGIMEVFNRLVRSQPANPAVERQRDDDVHGSTVLDDLQRSGRDPTFFQRCVLRVSARLKKPRRGNRKQSMAKEERSAETGVTNQRHLNALQSERYLPNLANGPELAGGFAGREPSVSMVDTKRSVSVGNFAFQRNSDDFTNSYQNVPGGSRQVPKRVSESSRGRASRTSGTFESHTTSVCSDVFEDSKANQVIQQKGIEANGGPPSAPPRSPISLMESFNFSGSTETATGADSEATLETGIEQSVDNEGPTKESDDSNSVGNSSAGTPSDALQESLSDKRAKEYEELMKRFEAAPTSTRKTSGLSQMSTSPRLGRRRLMEPKADISAEATQEETKVATKLDEVLNKPDERESKISTAALPPKPMVIQKYVNVKIPVLPSMSAAYGGPYMNVSGSATVGRASGRLNKPQPLQLKPASQWAQYDDDDGAIYHQVDPLVSGNPSISRSVENFGNYRNVNGVGSYENLIITGAPLSAKGGGISPSRQLTGSLNYILVDGAATDSNPSPKSSSAQGTNRNAQSPPFDSVPDFYPSSKTDYTMIDGKATQLLNRTRQQHWQQRVEDAQRQGKAK